MAEIQIKDFLRKHGFRHLRDMDRGATWGNGVVDLFVEKTFREPGKMRALMEQIRAASRKKEMIRSAEERKSEFVELTPEQHRIRQAALVKAAAPMEPASDYHVPIIDRATGKEIPDPKPELVEAATSADSEKKIARKKFSGEERLYVFGRLKAMFSSKMTDREIVAALTSEGVRQPDGMAMTSKYVQQMRSNWKVKPESAARYASILMPRTAPSTIEPPAPRPVVIAQPRTIPRSRFGFPLSIDTVLCDTEVSDQEKLGILLIFVTLPESAASVLLDLNLTATQKINVVEAIGQRKTKEGSGRNE